MKKKYNIICESCGEERLVGYAQYRMIITEKKNTKCRRCSALISDNSGRFKKGRTSWPKGTIGIAKQNSGSFGKREFVHPYKGTKGLMRANKTSFKKGTKPWNKGVKGVQSVWNKGLKLGKQSLEIRKKKSESQTGDKCYNWKGGITPENKKIRNSIEYRLWREAVFSRDNWTCQNCGVRGGIIHAHHIKEFCNYPELRFAIDNGITMCKKCHKEYHKITKT